MTKVEHRVTLLLSRVVRAVKKIAVAGRLLQLLQLVAGNIGKGGVCGERRREVLDTVKNQGQNIYIFCDIFEGRNCEKGNLRV